MMNDSVAPRLLLVNYHYIRDPGQYEHPGIHPIHPDDFRSGIEMMRSRFHMATPEEAEAFIYDEGRLPRDSILLTFDDGLIDHRIAANEVLNPLDIKSVFFVPSQPLAERIGLMVHKTHHLRAHTDPSVFSDDFIARLPQTWRRRARNDGAEKARTFYVYDTPENARIKYLINFVLPREIVEQTVNEIMKDRGENNDEFCRKNYMSAEDLRRLHTEGHMIGAHGHSHAPLPILDEASLTDELERNIRCLDDIIGEPPHWISYPIGRGTAIPENSAELCARFGFRVGLTLLSGWVTPGEPPDRVKRININDLSEMLS